MLPLESNVSKVSFRQWNGLEPLNEKPFDVIVAKMVLHYLSPHELGEIVPNLAAELAPHGSLVVSVPHSADSHQFINPEAESYTQQIQRQIGATGLTAAMWHYDHWVGSTLRLMPEEYVALLQNVKSSKGELKRLQFLFCPRGKRYEAAHKKLYKLGLVDTYGPDLTEIGEDLSDLLRAMANASEN